jgi:hypothetical protein
VLGPEHPDTLKNISRVVSVLSSLGRYDEGCKSGAAEVGPMYGRDVKCDLQVFTHANLFHLGNISAVIGLVSPD